MTESPQSTKDEEVKSPVADVDMFVCGDVPGGTNPTGKGFDDATAPNDPTAGRLADIAPEAA